MHWVEVRRWQDYKNPGSVNEVCARNALLIAACLEYVRLHVTETACLGCCQDKAGCVMSLSWKRLNL